MCVGCAMAAAAGATGARSYLQTLHATWLTPKRLRAITVGMCVAALGVSSIGLSGSSAGAKPHHAAGPAAHVRTR